MSNEQQWCTQYDPKRGIVGIRRMIRNAFGEFTTEYLYAPAQQQPIVTDAQRKMADAIARALLGKEARLYFPRVGELDLYGNARTRLNRRERSKLTRKENV